MRKTYFRFFIVCILITVFPSSQITRGEEKNYPDGQQTGEAAEISRAVDQSRIDLTQYASTPLAIAELLSLPVTRESEYTREYWTDSIEFYYCDDNYFSFNNLQREDIEIWGIHIGQSVEEAVESIGNYGSLYVVDDQMYSEECIGFLDSTGVFWELFLKYNEARCVASWNYRTDGYGVPNFIPYNEVRDIMQLENSVDKADLESWQLAYLQVIKNDVDEVDNPDSWFETIPYVYALAYIDGDDVPELIEYMPSFKDESSGTTSYLIKEYSRIYSYAGEELRMAQVNGACSYEQGTGKLLCTFHGGNTGIFATRDDIAYQYAGGELTEVGRGYYESHMTGVTYLLWNNVELVEAFNYPSPYDYYEEQAYKSLGVTDLSNPEMFSILDICNLIIGDKNAWGQAGDSGSAFETIRLQDYPGTVTAGEIIPLAGATDIYGDVYSDVIAGNISEFDNAIDYSLNGNFSRLTGTIIRSCEANMAGLANPFREDICLYVYGDGILLYRSRSVNLAGGEKQIVSVDLTGVNQMRIAINGKNFLRFCDAKLVKKPAAPAASEPVTENSTNGLNYPGVTEVSFNSMPITDLGQALSYPDVKKLYANWTPVTDLSAISSLIGLTILEISGTKVTSLDPIAGLVNLERLTVGESTISDISVVRNMTKLKSLDFWHSEVSDISVLAELSSLEEIYMSYSKVSTLASLMSLPNIRVLSVFGLSIPAEEMEQFKALHPDCIVYEGAD